MWLWILVGDTLAALIPSFTETQLTIMAFLLIMPSMWTTHMSMLSYFSILGILSSFFCLYAIFFVGFATDTSAPDYVSGSLLHPQPVQMIGDLDRIPLAIGLTMVAFGGHSVFPSICSSMANKEDYPRVLNLSYFIVGLVYGAIELAGYLMYGEATQKEITLNLIASYPGVLTQMVVWTIALNPMSKIAITLHPVALALEEFMLSPSQKRAAARNKPKQDAGVLPRLHPHDARHGRAVLRAVRAPLRPRDVVPRRLLRDARVGLPAVRLLPQAVLAPPLEARDRAQRRTGRTLHHPDVLRHPRVVPVPRGLKGTTTRKIGGDGFSLG